MFALQVVSLAERLQSLSECVLRAGVTFDNAVAAAVVVFQKHSVLFEAVMVLNAPHRLPPAIQPNNSDMLALQAELSAESLQRLAERIKDIVAIYSPSVFIGVIEHQIAVAVVMIEERSHPFILP